MWRARCLSPQSRGINSCHLYARVLACNLQEGVVSYPPTPPAANQATPPGGRATRGPCPRPPGHRAIMGRYGTRGGCPAMQRAPLMYTSVSPLQYPCTSSRSALSPRGPSMYTHSTTADLAINTVCQKWRHSDGQNHLRATACKFYWISQACDLCRAARVCVRP